MNGERLLLDTVFIQALLNRRDQYHAQAQAILPRVRNASEVWVTEAVLIEVGNALSAVNRTAAVQFIEQCYHTPNLQVVTVDTPLLTRALQLYRERPDKTWGLTDCISFVVMQEQGLTDAVTESRTFHPSRLSGAVTGVMKAMKLSLLATSVPFLWKDVKRPYPFC